MSPIRLVALAAILLAVAPVAFAQKKKQTAPFQAPEPGYLYPPGGQVGRTLDVQVAGFDWTPDVQLFVLDPRVKLDISGDLGPILVPPPPYWFGAKSTLASLPLPRERLAKLTLPAGLPVGPVRWMTASASGVGAKSGTFWVGEFPEVLEEAKSKQPQKLPALPITVNGRLSRIEEVDRYRFSVPKDGPVTCEMIFRRLGVNANAMLTVRDRQDRVVADAVDSDGDDVAMTFLAKAGEEYTISVNDLDFRGDRAYVYRLNLSAGPRVVATIPAVTKRGETRDMEFVGYGVATGKPVLESVTRKVAFPADAKADAFAYRLETPFGMAPVIRIPLSDRTETVVDVAKETPLTLPAAVTGVLGGTANEARFRVEGKKGDVWQLAAEARRYGSPLDVALAVLNTEGKELARIDDLPGTTDSGLSFPVPVDGAYTIIVADVSGTVGTRNAVFRLTANQITPDFTLNTTVRLNVPVGESAELIVKAARVGGFKEPIALTVTGLPTGVTVPANLVIPADKPELKIPVSVAADAPAEAGLLSVTGTAGTQTRPAYSPIVGNMAILAPDDERTSFVLLATTLTPRLKLVAVEADGGRKVHRGSTHPAEVTIERLNEFEGEISLQMSAAQSYQRQGITGPDMIVPAKETQAFYPCFMPEWLETTRTSRMELIGVVKVPDAKGNLRYLATPMNGRITMSIEGSLLKVDSTVREIRMAAGETVTVPVTVLRSAKLAEAVKLELRVPEELSPVLRAEPVVVAPGQTTANVRITCAKGIVPGDTHSLTIRGTAMQDGKYAVVSEATITLDSTPSR